MRRRFLPLALMAACASKGGEGARGQGETEVIVPVAPAGNAWRTARGAGWKDVLDDLASADVVFVSGDDALQLGVIEYLYARGRLHAVGLLTFPRTAQKALDDFSFGRMTEAELLGQGGTADDHALLAFAQERRLPLLGLGVEAEVLATVAEKGLDGLTEDQRISLPPVKPAGGVADPLALTAGLQIDVAADVITRWYRSAAPEGAQVAVVRRLVVDPHALTWWELPGRLFERTGKIPRTLVACTGTAETAGGEAFTKGFADYVWFTGAK